MIMGVLLGLAVIGLGACIVHRLMRWMNGGGW